MLFSWSVRSNKSERLSYLLSLHLQDKRVWTGRKSYGQTKSTNAGHEAPVEPKKKKRPGGNDSIELRREKSQLQLPVKKRELELKEN